MAMLPHIHFLLIIWSKDAAIKDHQITKGDLKAIRIHRIISL